MKPRQSKPSEVAKVITSLGFILDRKAGSHRIYKHPTTGATVSLPFHGGDVPTGTLRGIIGQMGISVEDFNRMA